MSPPRRILPLLLVAAASSALPSPAAATSPRAKLVGEAAFVFGSPQRLGQASLDEASVVIRLAKPAVEADLLALENVGAVVLRRANGRHRGAARDVAARVTPDALDRVTRLPQVTAVHLDRSPLGTVSPSVSPPDVIPAEVETHAVWATLSEQGLPVRGAGVTLCNIDQGIDVFHPLFWRPDGGHFPWHDVDGDGLFTPGIDGVDLDGDGIPTVVLHLDAAVYNGPSVVDDSLASGYQAGHDWLFVDDNGNGQRDQGRDAGFGDGTPTLGERWLVADDVNGNGTLDLGERLVALGTAKIKSVNWGGVVYRRGENLVDVPRTGAGHGTSVASVLVGGAPGLSPYAGLVPDADLVVGAFGNGFVGEVALADFCIEEGARVVVHEYAPWFGHFLDGSSPMAALIDASSADGVAHINPTGNLGGSDKQYKRAHPSGERSTLEVSNPFGGVDLILLTVLWREPERPLTFELELADGQTTALGGALGPETINLQGVTVAVSRANSERGTAMLDLQIWGDANLQPGIIQLHVDDGAAPSEPPLTVVGYVADGNVSWSSGAHFESHANEDHLLCYPSTADGAIAISAYVGNGYRGGTPGQLAESTSRGVRIDGLELMSLAAPNDPITALASEEEQGAYRVFGGTSGAAPHVAAAAAMLLQLDPTLDGGQVRDALRQGALVDEAVGSAPDEAWGYGKLRIHQTLYGSPAPEGAAPTIVVPPTELVAGTPQFVAVEVQGATRIELDREYDGVYDEEIVDGFDVAFDLPGVHYAKVRAIAASGQVSAALVPLVVGEAVPEPTPTPKSSANADEDGGGCSHVPARRTGSGAWLLLLALAGLMRRHRPRAR